MRRPKSANRVSVDDVRTLGGRELVLNRLVNHYKALSNVKPKVIIESPKPHVDSKKSNKSIIDFIKLSLMTTTI